MHDVFREGFAVTELNVISGFLGSGKTTLIRHLTQRMSRDKTIAVIENDFGEVGLDAELLRQGSVVVSEINSGCGVLLAHGKSPRESRLRSPAVCPGRHIS